MMFGIDMLSPKFVVFIIAAVYAAVLIWAFLFYLFMKWWGRNL